MHANGITADTPFVLAQELLQLVAAFTQKNDRRIAELIAQGVSVGARLDYLLPLYDESYHCGEDIFVASTKYILGGSATESVKLAPHSMKHGNDPYTNDELKDVTNYVDNSVQIRELLASAKNKSLVIPTKAAVDYMLQHANNYRDSNNNPVIVFIPGAVALPHYSTTALIAKAIEYGANINDVGFFGVPGIVWSIIIGDIAATNYFLNHGAKLNIVDDMGNQHVAAWAASTWLAADNNAALRTRLHELVTKLSDRASVLELNTPNYRGVSVIDFIKQVNHAEERHLLQP